MYKSSRIIIRNDTEGIDPVIAYIRVISPRLGLNSKETDRICYALDDTLQNIILFDFLENDDSEQIVLDVDRVPAGIKITITYQGIPGNPFLNEAESLEEIASSLTLDGGANQSAEQIRAISSLVIHKLIDRYTQKNLGSKGRAVTLLLYSSEGKIKEDAEQIVPQPQAPDEYFETIRPANPDDSTSISRLFYKSYGYSYINDIVYYPLRLAESVNDGELRSTVALSNTKNVIGHIALYQPYPDAGIAEWGMAISDPAFRNQGIMTRLTEEVMRQGSHSTFGGFFVHSVTNHDFTQKVCRAEGFSVVALLLGFAPIGLSFKSIHEELMQRESTFIDYKALHLDAGSALFLPDRHRTMIKTLYEGIGVTVTRKTGAPDSATKEKSLLSDTVITSLNVAEIILEKSGSDAMEQISLKTRKLCIAKVDILYLFIDMEDSEAVRLVEGLEKEGYIFAGIFPRYHHRHSLVLQYVNNIRFDYEKIISLTPLATKLKKYIRRFDLNQRV